MINILVPIAGKTPYFDLPEYPFPKPLIEINGNPMVGITIENLGQIQGEIRYVFVVTESDCSKYYLDNVLKLLTDDNCEIVKLRSETRGAICSSLMAVEFINNDTPLIISNSDQFFEDDFNEIISYFQEYDYDAGVVTFETVHPRWSFVRLGEDNEIIEAAEKKPISRHGIAGLYYFKKGQYFVDAAMRVIEKDANVDGMYYIAPTLNELILDNKKLGALKIDAEKYHTFYMPSKIKEYELYSQREK